MSQIDKDRLPKHIAIIMDGNGRWANKKGLPRTFGHKAGAEALRSIVKICSQIGIGALTVYAFSTENWKRPKDEVSFLMTLLSDYIDSEIEELDSKNVKIQFIGAVDELADNLQEKIRYAQEKTQFNSGLCFNIAVNYGSRTEILKAVQKIAQKAEVGEIKAAELTEQHISNYLYTAGLPDPDILIRSSGEMRLSNFLLWQLAYTELWMTDKNWPDFKPDDLCMAIIDYQKRDRRFGGLNK